MMAEYIDRECITEQADEVLGLLDALRSGGSLDYSDYCELFDALCEISALPPADVRPVVRGRWIEIGEESDGNYSIWFFRCSECQETGVQGMNFCPNCGADMRANKENTP